MKLLNKYIKINNKNYKNVIDLLYSEGYKKDGDYSFKIVIDSINIRFKINDNILYLAFYRDNVFYFSLDIPTNVYDPNGYEYYDINKMLRETKLKRILK